VPLFFASGAPAHEKLKPMPKPERKPPWDGRGDAFPGQVMPTRVSAAPPGDRKSAGFITRERLRGMGGALTLRCCTHARCGQTGRGQLVAGRREGGGEEALTNGSGNGCHGVERAFAAATTAQALGRKHPSSGRIRAAARYLQWIMRPVRPRDYHMLRLPDGLRRDQSCT